MRTRKVENFDHWIRHDFQTINTALEELYFAQEDRNDVLATGDELKERLLKEGNQLITELLEEGNTNEGFDSGFELLGNVGFFMAACRRHELTEPSRETRSPLRAASALAMQLGASLGVIPRFATAHLETYNRAINGKYKSFTHLPDEKKFLDYNTRGLFAFIRASQALLQTLPLGISHPITYDLLLAAKQALKDVSDNNEKLFNDLDIARFFYCVRPYYKPHRVGLHVYRGANAGDFAGINVIDLLLGLCRADDPYYSQLLVDKFLFMLPADQLTLRDCMRRESLLDSFLLFLDSEPKNTPDWFIKNTTVFLEVCELHGQIAIQHHDQLIKRFIETPSFKDNLQEQPGLTASGPPLPVLLRGLKKLCDVRAAIDDENIPSRYNDIKRLRERLQSCK